MEMRHDEFVTREQALSEALRYATIAAANRDSKTMDYKQLIEVARSFYNFLSGAPENV